MRKSNTTHFLHLVGIIMIIISVVACGSKKNEAPSSTSSNSIISNLSASTKNGISAVLNDISCQAGSGSRLSYQFYIDSNNPVGIYNNSGATSNQQNSYIGKSLWGDVMIMTKHDSGYSVILYLCPVSNLFISGRSISRIKVDGNPFAINASRNCSMDEVTYAKVVTELASHGDLDQTYVNTYFHPVDIGANPSICN